MTVLNLACDLDINKKKNQQKQPQKKTPLSWAFCSVKGKSWDAQSATTRVSAPVIVTSRC